MPNLPNFNDLPDGSSSINHTGWVEIDEAFLARPPVPAPPPPNPVGYSSQFPPHPSYADGSAPLTPPPQTATEVNEARRRVNPAWAAAPYEMDGTPVRRPRVEDLERRSATAIETLREATERFTTTINTGPQVCDPSPPRRPRRRREVSDPDAAIRKDPNAWSLREAVELCKLLEVVLPEAGFHIALTGPLLYLDGKRKECHLMFYQIRGTEPNYEILWKYLTVAGVIRSPSYPEKGWLVKATYRGKAVDCLFPNAGSKKAKKNSSSGLNEYKGMATAFPPPEVGSTPPPPTHEMTATEVNAHAYQQGVRAAGREIERHLEDVEAAQTALAGLPVPPMTRPQDFSSEAPIVYRPGTLVRHINGVPEFSAPYTAAELLATPAPAPVPAAEAQDEVPF